MRRCRSWYRIHQLLQARLPLSPGPLVDSLALWLQGTLLAENGCLDRVAAALAARGGNVHTLRRRLCDGPRRMRSGRTPGGRTRNWTRRPASRRCWPGSCPGWCRPVRHRSHPWCWPWTPPTTLNQTALPVAWRLVPAQASLSWMDILCRLLALLAPAVPTGMEVPGLAPLPALRPRPDLLARGAVRGPAGRGLGWGRGHPAAHPQRALALPQPPAGHAGGAPRGGA